ncbi:hypothetical protein NA56DRAFT_666476 [Hyaloscypha hepaticicola]|uniref:2EXR domain-containing protein n=1 Tax=Hyaloscypha hepaticicola TaxID=2082293 RepID=A0A2J6PE78_9HELO|nr:hypothetical protein NA56DRAFT_666476 [Hyaloscypha hepaticicola]
MCELTKDTDSPSKIPSSIEDRLAALEGHNFELWKENQSLQSRICTLEVRLATAEDTLINLSPQNLGMQTHKSFAFFPKLSPELRRMIWTFARPGPRVLKIFEKKEGDQRSNILHCEIACTSPRMPRVTFPWHPKEPQSSCIYFDCSSDFVYIPRRSRGDKGNPTRSNINPYIISFTIPNKVMNVIHEVTESWEHIHIPAYCFSSATKALLVLEREGMLQGSAELSEFTLTVDTFNWQGTLTLQQAYIDASGKSRYKYLAGSWNLTSIQRARFGAVGRDG